jgi:hypothetical protein
MKAHLAWIQAIGVLAALGVPGMAAAQAPPSTDTPERTALKVCQDPNNLPFSNTVGEGFENKIAELFGHDLGLPVTYYEFPNRMNFIRNTLRYKLPTDDYPCDIVMGVPAGFDQVSVTRPYYRRPIRSSTRRARAWMPSGRPTTCWRCRATSWRRCASACTTARPPRNGWLATTSSIAACPIP